MSNEIELFNFQGQEVRVMPDDQGEPWFLAADVASVLGYTNTSHLTRLLDDEDKGVRVTVTPSGSQPMVIISEGGLFQVIVQRKTGRMEDQHLRDQVRNFQRFVTHEVLPSIRRTGNYVINQLVTEPELPATYLDALKALVQSEESKAALETENRVLNVVNDELVTEIEVAAPKADAYDKLAANTEPITLQIAAKALGIGPNKLFGVLKDLRVLIRGGSNDKMPMAAYKDWFTVDWRTKVLTDYWGNQHEQSYFVTLVRPEKLANLARHLLKNSVQLDKWKLDGSQAVLLAES